MASLALTPVPATVPAIIPQQRSNGGVKVLVPGRIVSGPPVSLCRTSHASLDGRSIPTSPVSIQDSQENRANAPKESSNNTPPSIPRHSSGTMCADMWKRHSTSADEAKMKVHNMHEEMQVVEDTIAELQRENDWLKFKLLQGRRSSSGKYCSLHASLLTLGVFGEWKRIAEAARLERVAEKTEAMRVNDHIQFDAHSLNLDLQVCDAQEKQREAEREVQELRARLEQAEAMIRVCSEQISQYQLPPPRISQLPPSSESAEYMKSKLHEILRSIDPRYMPPLHGPSVEEVIYQQRQAYKQGMTMRVPAPHVPVECLRQPAFFVRTYGSAPATTPVDDRNLAQD
eukprot:GEMP01052635.1.p1 GENE.GEMP01052635.1~~GEMP01052635.1.p1  ORF type:complete len:343 (+),score=75.21 GEMP01052635.1:145-1173(+)